MKLGQNFKIFKPRLDKITWISALLGKNFPKNYKKKILAPLVITKILRKNTLELYIPGVDVLKLPVTFAYTT